MKNHIYMIIAAVCLGTIGVLVKLIGGSMHFMTLNFYRLFFAFLILLIICPFIDKNTFKITKKDFLMYLIIGFFLAVSISLNNIAFLYAPVQNVALITSLFPFFVLIFAYFLLKEKITTTKIITLIIAIVGLSIINPIQAEGMIGNILSLIVAALDGLLATLMRKEDKTHSIGDVMWFFLFASIFLLPFPFVYGFGQISIYVLLLGLISTGVAYLFYNLAFQKIEAEIGSIITLIISPLLSILLAVAIINEGLNLRVIIGGALLIISGMYLQLHNKSIK